ncbi:hypothetical protein OE88DRAFT_1736480 [Heliocybe sulcata]|uniref:DUF4604 domain-containing protein n=1 Tax=Heliocybe sulcata TaxID=5364 RepID=A0A5C3MZN3_9AGAM|nr:hypothetical protein OE88DRAFT_1736480 [Heliocybe sulcata]
MAPKEPSRAQLSSRLAYQQHTPSFLQKFKNRVAGIEDDEDEEEEYEYDGSGRPPIPKRPPIPERPPDNPGSADELDEEDADDEKPQVVVLKEGRHMTELEAENERRKAKGLAPVDDSFDTLAKDVKSSKATALSDTSKQEPAAKPPEQQTGLSFSSSKSALKHGKRKAVGELRDEGKASESSSAPTGKGSKKKAKKPEKKLLSFGDDA